MIWYVIIATFLYLGYFSKKPERHYKISMGFLFMFTAFRNVYLGDYKNTTYITAFHNTPELGGFFEKQLEYERGYELLSSLAKTVCDDFRFFQVLYTLVAILLLDWVIRKLQFSIRENNLFLFVYFTMRFVLNNFIILRQNMANLVVWHLILVDAGLVIAFLVLFLASQFHITAIANIFTVASMRGMAKLNRKIIFTGTITASMIMLLFSSSIANRLVNNIIDMAGTKYSQYIIGDEGVEVGFNWIYYFLRLVFFVLFYLCYDIIQTTKKDKLFIISAIAVIIGSINVDIFSRFMEYFMIGIYGIITVSYQVFNSRSRKIYLFVLYFALMIIMVRQLYVYGAGYLTDYFWFWKQGVI